MKIMIVIDAKLPVVTYGGTERVVYYLGHELSKMGHDVYYLSSSGSECPFATCIPFNHEKTINEQIPDFIDIIHFQSHIHGYTGKKPYVVTVHGNEMNKVDKNAIYVSINHAMRHNSESYVYNGLDWDDYGEFNENGGRDYYHFLGKAAWKVKNVRGAIDVVDNLPDARLVVLGGDRLNFKMGFRFTLSPKISFKGMVGGAEKINYLNHSKGLIFPVLWDEPFGLAITESLYCGTPVFGTTYGSLPELVIPEVGFLTDSKREMIDFLKEGNNFSSRICHEYARDMFNSRIMAEKYLEKYELVINGKNLNDEASIEKPLVKPSKNSYKF